MYQELINILGSEDRLREAVKHLCSVGGENAQDEVTAIGHLEMLITGQGQFNAALDGGLAEKFPELVKANQEAASKLTGEDKTLM